MSLPDTFVPNSESSLQSAREEGRDLFGLGRLIPTAPPGGTSRTKSGELFDQNLVTCFFVCPQRFITF